MQINRYKHELLKMETKFKSFGRIIEGFGLKQSGNIRPENKTLTHIYCPFGPQNKLYHLIFVSILWEHYVKRPQAFVPVDWAV